jgi:hypothetical protein
VTVFTDSTAAWNALKEVNSPPSFCPIFTFPTRSRSRSRSRSRTAWRLAAHASKWNPQLPIIFCNRHPEFAELVEQQHPGSVFLKPLDMDAIEQFVRGLVPITP